MFEFVEYACGFTLRLICSIILRRTSGNNCAQTPVTHFTAHDGEKFIEEVETEITCPNL